MKLSRFAWLPVAALLLAGCAATPPETPLVLTMADVDGDLAGDPAAGWFVDEVASRSAGRLVIEPALDCCGAGSDARQQLITQVRARNFDLGWIAAPGLEDFGFASMQVLSAPGLIDSYAAEAAVLGSDLGPDVMHGFDVAAMTPIALEPGVLQRPVGSGVALLAPHDWSGLTVWSARSGLAAASLTALGATPSQVDPQQRDAGLEAGAIAAVVGPTDQARVSNAVVSAAALWPAISVLFANPNSYRELTPEQIGWLRDAAAAVTARTADVAAIDTQAVATLCAAGGHLARQSDTQRSATAAALEPVYSVLRSSPILSGLLDRIEALKPAEGIDELPVPELCLHRG